LTAFWAGDVSGLQPFGSWVVGYLGLRPRLVWGAPLALDGVGCELVTYGLQGFGMRTKKYDAAEFLTDDETISAYLTEALESDDPRYIAKALGAVARARGGIAQLARDTGIAREALYRALSETGNPELGTVLKVVHALGVRLSATLVA